MIRKTVPVITQFYSFSCNINGNGKIITYLFSNWYIIITPTSTFIPQTCRRVQCVNRDATEQEVMITENA